MFGNQHTTDSYVTKTNFPPNSSAQELMARMKSLWVDKSGRARQRSEAHVMQNRGGSKLIFPSPSSRHCLWTLSRHNSFGTPSARVDDAASTGREPPALAPTKIQSAIIPPTVERTVRRGNFEFEIGHIDEIPPRARLHHQQRVAATAAAVTSPSPASASASPSPAAAPEPTPRIPIAA
ncbi:hypothetical protein ACHAWF_017245 [Thalassiosira exigua]